MHKNDITLSMVDGKDVVIKRLQSELHDSTQWVVAE